MQVFSIMLVSPDSSGINQVVLSFFTVFLSDMSGLLCTVNETFATCTAPIFFELIMMLAVAFEVPFVLSPVIRTVRAHNPFGCVCTCMTIQVTNVFEGTATSTMHALMFWFSVRDSMSGQLALERERFSTLSTLEFESFVCVHMFG